MILLGIVTHIPKTAVNSREDTNSRTSMQIYLTGKLLECIVHEQLIDYLKKGELVCKSGREVVTLLKCSVPAPLTD